MRPAHKGVRCLAMIAQSLRADVVLSAAADWDEIVAVRALAAMGKPVVSFNHGYVPYENEINHLGLSERKMKLYRENLRRARRVVANSAYQMRCIEGYQPELKGKLDFVNNAVEPFRQLANYGGGDERVVAVSGGTRPIKGNDVVARAVGMLRARGVACRLDVYGATYAENPALGEALPAAGGCLLGQVPGGEFLVGLQGADVFVMDSVHEPFGISALDALHAGCSLLLSRNCGVAELLALEAGDLIDDQTDEAEVAEKVGRLLAEPNSERLYRSLDFSKVNWDVSAAKLYAVCREVWEGQMSGRGEQ